MPPTSVERAIFPLPPISHPKPDRSSPSPRVQLRRKRSEVVTNLANDAIHTLNQLASHAPSSEKSLSESSPNLFKRPDVKTNAASLRAVGQVHQAAAVFVKRLSPYYHDAKEDVGPHLNTVPADIAVSGASNSAAVPLVSGKVSLPSNRRKVPLIDLLPPEVKAIYEKENPSLLLPPDQIAKARKAMLVSSNDDYAELIVRLSDLGMVEFRLTPKAFNGVFGLPKPNGSQRFLVDARPANSMFVEPPPMSMCTPDVLASLQIPAGATVYVAKTDISDFYHRLLLPEWLIPYFALPGVKAGKVGMGATYGEDTLIYPCCTTLPMGWSHSPYIAQAAHENLLDTETSMQPVDRMGGPDVDMRLNRTMHGIYIDDGWQVGTDKADVTRIQIEYLAMLERFFLDANKKKTVLPTADGCEIIGMELHGRNLTFGMHPQKLLALIHKTKARLAYGTCTGKQLASLVGIWSWAFLARRPFFALFSAVYRFVESADFRVYTIWPTVRNELNMAIKLAPLLLTNLAAPWFGSMFAVDASSSGQGVVMAKLDPAVLATVATLPLPSEEQLKDPAPHPTTVEAGWVVVVASKWHKDEHINLQEATAVKTALRRAASSPAAAGSRILVWSDSMVVTCAIRKGRSSSFALLARLRSQTALILAMDFYVHINWIPTDFNPADEPSRRFQHNNPAPRLFGKEFSSDYTGDGPVYSRFLCDAALKPNTHKAYTKGEQLFHAWLVAGQRAYPSSVGLLDDALCEFTHHLYTVRNGKCRSYTEAAKSAVCRSFPGAKGNLLFTTQALQGWKRLVPPKSHPPLTWKVTLVIAFTLVSMGDLDCAIGTLLAFDGYLRIGELANLLTTDVLLPGDRRVGVELDAVQLLLRETKTGPNKWASIKDPFVITLLRWQLDQCENSNRPRLFPFNESRFRRQFQKAVSLLELPGKFVPHSLRHGKATHDFLCGVPLETILVLGRWAAHKSARLYVQVGRAQLLGGRTPLWISNFAVLLLTDLTVSFALADPALAEALSGVGL
jgi:integrase